MRSVNDSAAKDSLLRIPNKKTNLAVFPALHKNSLELEIPLIWSVLLKNHQIPVAVGCRQVSSRVSRRSLAAPSLTDHTVFRLDVCLNPMLELNANSYLATPLHIYLVQTNLVIRNKLVLRNHFPWPICKLLHKDKEHLAFRVTEKFLITKFDCNKLNQQLNFRIFLHSIFLR